MPAVMATDRLRFLSGGRIDIRLYKPGRLVPPPEIFDAISSGNLDAGFRAPAFNVGKHSALALFMAMSFGPEGPEFMVWLHHGGGLELHA